MNALKEYFLSEFNKWEAKPENQRKHLTDFATYLGFLPTSLSNWMNGYSRPRLSTVHKLAKILGNEIYTILGLRIPGENPEMYPSVIHIALVKAVNRVSDLGIPVNSEESVRIFIEELSRVDSNVNFKTNKRQESSN